MSQQSFCQGCAAASATKRCRKPFLSRAASTLKISVPRMWKDTVSRRVSKFITLFGPVLELHVNSEPHFKLQEAWTFGPFEWLCCLCCCSGLLCCCGGLGCTLKAVLLVTQASIAEVHTPFPSIPSLCIVLHCSPLAHSSGKHRLKAQIPTCHCSDFVFPKHPSSIGFSCRFSNRVDRDTGCGEAAQAFRVFGVQRVSRTVAREVPCTDEDCETGCGAAGSPMGVALQAARGATGAVRETSGDHRWVGVARRCGKFHRWVWGGGRDTGCGWRGGTVARYAVRRGRFHQWGSKCGVWRGTGESGDAECGAGGWCGSTGVWCGWFRAREVPLMGVARDTGCRAEGSPGGGRDTGWGSKMPLKFRVPGLTLFGVIIRVIVDAFQLPCHFNTPKP